MIRQLLTLLLGLTLATTSVSAAVMHAEMQGARQMVICADNIAGSGFATVTLDATGKPIASPHRCPDCTAAISAVLPDSFRFGPSDTATTAPYPRPAPERTSNSPPPQSARDPPALA